MALFSGKEDQPKTTGNRLTGMQRYLELMGRDTRRFLVANALTLLGFLPFGVVLLFALMTENVFILVIGCLLSGIPAGSSMACMYDAVLRSLRDVQGKALANYRKAWKQNLKQSVIPGMIYSLLLGVYIFVLMVFLISESFPGYPALILYIVSLLLVTSFFSLYFIQVALFDKTAFQRILSCLYFLIRFFPRTIVASAIQIVYWALMLLVLPYSLVLFPVFGFWFIQFTFTFLLYRPLNNTFKIEEKIAEAFPEQVPYYEEDEDWAKRRRKEDSDANKNPEHPDVNQDLEDHEIGIPVTHDFPV